MEILKKWAPSCHFTFKCPPPPGDLRAESPDHLQHKIRLSHTTGFGNPSAEQPQVDLIEVVKISNRWIYEQVVLNFMEQALTLKFYLNIKLLSSYSGQPSRIF